MNNKKVLAAGAILVILSGIMFGLDKFGPKTKNQTTQKTVTVNSPKSPEEPRFITGRVVDIKENELYIKAGSDTKKVIVSPETIYDKQVSKDNVVKVVSAYPEEVKLSSTVMVHYDKDTESGYTANSVQILID